MISEDDIKKIAYLARLSLPADKLANFTNQFNSILSCVSELEKVNVDAIEPMSHVHGSSNIFRDDKLEPHMENKDALRNAPNVCGQFIRVPLIVDQEN